MPPKGWRKRPLKKCKAPNCHNLVKRDWRDYCSRKCSATHAPRNRNFPAPDRFWNMVDKNGPIPPHRPKLGKCWLMPCHFWTGDKLMLAHRFSWQLHFGDIPNSMLVLHKCDCGTFKSKRVCVNPHHLWLGTHADNNRDCFAKGRNNPKSYENLKLGPISRRKRSSSAP